MTKRDRCDGCGGVAKHYDCEGVPLCNKCWAGLLEDARKECGCAVCKGEWSDILQHHEPAKGWEGKVKRTTFADKNMTPMPWLIRAMRKVLLMTQTDLANKIGVTLATVARWEGARSRPDNRAQRALYKLISSLDKRQWAEAMSMAPANFVEGHG